MYRKPGTTSLQEAARARGLLHQLTSLWHPESGNCHESTKALQQRKSWNSNIYHTDGPIADENEPHKTGSFTLPWGLTLEGRKVEDKLSKMISQEKKEKKGPLLPLPCLCIKQWSVALLWGCTKETIRDMLSRVSYGLCTIITPESFYNSIPTEWAPSYTSNTVNPAARQN